MVEPLSFEPYKLSIYFAAVNPRNQDTSLIRTPFFCPNYVQISKVPLHLCVHVHIHTMQSALLVYLAVL